MQKRHTDRESYFDEQSQTSKNYYIPDGSQLRTIRKEHPFSFTLPVGLRISW